MLVEWSERLELGDPVVDSEHRYLVELINNLHEQQARGALQENLARVFTHLAHYVRVHFANEEALMAAVGYPQLKEHREQHRQLLKESMALSERYMEGRGAVTEDTLAFLRAWTFDHIAESDMKIRDYWGGERPSQLTRVPAFAAHSGTAFKVCSMCGKSWRTFAELKSDKSKVMRGYQLDRTNHLYNLILFNCTCGTTLALFLKQFLPEADIPFVIDEHAEPGHRPAWCLRSAPGGPCLPKCACSYTQRILEAMG